MAHPPATPGPTFQALRATLRPPRAVVVFNGDGDWISHAARALYECGQVWGGSGFLLVPHHSGTVNPALVRLAVDYDPDYVVEAQTTITQFEASYPGSLPVVLDGRRLEGAERAEVLGRTTDTVVRVGGARDARDLIAAACTPHRYVYRDRAGTWSAHEQQHHLTLADDRLGGHQPFSRAPLADAVDEADALGVPGGLYGLWSLAAAVRWGFGSPPPLPFPNASPPDFGDAKSLMRRALASRRRELPFNDEGAGWRSAWAPSEVGTVRVQPMRARDKPNLVVVGDTADDFALAQGWHLLFGESFWIPEAPPFGKKVGDLVLWGLGQDMLAEMEYHDRKVIVTSTSVEDQVLDEVVESWIAGRPRLLTYAVDEAGEPDLTELERDTDPPRPDRLPPDALDFAGGGLLVVTDQYDLPLALPSWVDEFGEISLSVNLPPLAPAHPDLARRPDLTWQIDVDTADARIPRMRGITPRVLQAEEGDLDSFVRLSRGGLSCFSASWGFVAAGSTTIQAMAKPRLQFPSMVTWADGMAEPNGMRTRFSDAGQRIEVLRRLWGSREILTRDWSGPLRPVLLGFHAEGKTSSAAFPNHDGVVIRAPEAYLSFNAMVRLTACGPEEADVAALRAEVDRLCGARVLHRGLILRCEACKNLAFLTIDEVGSVNTCRRCGAENPMTMARWHRPVDEPTWWYDLHPAARELVAADAGVGLLAANHLRQGARSYDDVSEIEFVEGSTPVAEVDLLAAVDGRVILGEAKTTPTLGTRKQREAKARKLVKVAAAVRADEILLCSTSASDWPAADVSAIQAASATIEGHALIRPVVRLLTGLGGDVKDVRVQ